MDNVIQLFTWTVHLADHDDEWSALCGDDGADLLIDDPRDLKPGYTVCSTCQTAALTSASYGVTSESNGEDDSANGERPPGPAGT
jgi:hypothetical protein